MAHRPGEGKKEDHGKKRGAKGTGAVERKVRNQEYGFMKKGRRHGGQRYGPDGRGMKKERQTVLKPKAGGTPRRKQAVQPKAGGTREP